MIQTQAPQLTFVQQIMPYLVIFVIGLLGALGLVIKAYATKLVNQLQANQKATTDAATAASSAALTSAEAQKAVADHNAEAMSKLDTVIQQTNGINTAVETRAAGLQAQVNELKAAVNKTNGGT
jgi:hypothetical protein